MSPIADMSPVQLLFLVTKFDRGGAETIIARPARCLPCDQYAGAGAAPQGQSGRIAAELLAVGVPAHDLQTRLGGQYLSLYEELRG